MVLEKIVFSSVALLLLSSPVHAQFFKKKEDAKPVATTPQAQKESPKGVQKNHQKKVPAKKKNKQTPTKKPSVKTAVTASSETSTASSSTNSTTVKLEGIEQALQRLELSVKEMAVSNSRVNGNDSEAATNETLDDKTQASIAIHKENIVVLQKKIDSIENAIAEGLDRQIVQNNLTELEQNIVAEEEKIEQILKDAASQEEQTVTDTVPDVQEQRKTVTEDEKEETAEKTKDTSQEDAHPIGLSLEMGLASSYMFRGLNVLQSSSQRDKHSIYSLGAGYSIGDTGLSVAYWSAYQIRGNNAPEMVDVGLGHEQDLILGYEKEFGKKALSAGLTYYFYPFATYSGAGTKNPSWLEPAVGISYSGAVSVGLGVSYMAGLQEVLRDFSYLYLNPTLSKEIAITDSLSTNVGISTGLKVFKNADGISDNMFDLSLDWDWSYAVSSTFSITPGAHLTWTNWEDIEETNGTQTTITRRNAGEEYVIWFSLAAGLDL